MLMRIFSALLSVLFASLLLSLASCSEEKENWTPSESVGEFMPLEVGNYITYRVDSLVTNPAFATSLETHSYQIKHEVDAEITDNLGRPSYRIFMYRRNADGTTPWQAAGSYFITPLANQVELVENNLRFIKLKEPLREGFSWKGNAYLPESPFQALGYNISVDNSMNSWDYVYDRFEPVTEINGQVYNNVWTVEQIDEMQGNPQLYPDSYANRARFVEKYAKNVGLIYRQLILWEYEVNQTATPVYSGFGVTMWMIDHNY